MSFAIISTSAILDFDLVSLVGEQGKNSTVYLANDKQLDAQLVMKVIEKTRFATPDEFYAEAKRLYDSEHQHVVQIKYACQDNDNIYLAMPYYQNGSLKSLMNRRFLTVREIIRYSLQFLQGLNNIHVKGFIHFDIKPDNILLSNTNEALVADFGISKNMDGQGLSPIGNVYISHLPPEAFTETAQSMLYDIYSAGLTMYRMCNGNQTFYGQLSQLQKAQRFDFDALKLAISSGTFPSRTEYFPHIPNALRKAINKDINPNKGDRHATVLDLMNQLSPIDKLLDWQFTSYGDRQEWVLDTDGNTIRVTYTWDANNHTIQTTKIAKPNGQTKRVIAGCMNHLAVKNVGKKVQALLLSLEKT